VSETEPGGGAAVTIAQYERLRDHVLAGTTTGGFGLVILMREGLAAWLAHAPAPTFAITDVNTPKHPAAAVTPTVSGDIHADMVSVLANMAMAIYPEVYA
jgi:hypothetical protein